MPTAALSSTTVRPARLPLAEREHLTDALYAVQADVFDGVSRATFARYVVSPPADGNVLRIVRGPDGQPVGYAALHHVDLVFDGQPIRVIRPTTAMRAAWRGKGSIDRFLAMQIIRLLLTAGRRRTYLLSSPVSPISFHWVHRGGAQVWPDPERVTPDGIRRLMHGLADHLTLPVGSAGDPDIRRIGWIVRESAAERERIARSTSPAIRLYLERNPAYRDGEGLLTLIPIDTRCIVQGLSYALRRAVGRIPRRVSGGAEARRQRG